MFKKYTDIENSYRAKYINDFFDRHPEMREARWGITEKIDGSNCSFIFDKQESGKFKFSYGKRSGLIASDENFYGIQNVVKEMDPFIRNVILQLNHFPSIMENATTFTLFGELYGPGIQKRIDYGTKKRIAFFDIAIDGQFVNQSTFFTLMKMFDEYNQYTVPMLAVTDSFDHALQYDTHFNSLMGPKCGELENECEGVVIKPWLADMSTLIDQYGHPENFYIKSKNEKFAEKMKTKYKKPMEPQSEALTNAQSIFAEYLNENRIKSVFSKEGEISDMKEMGKYIKLILEDAKEDFMKDHYEDVFMDKELSDKERGKIFKIAGKILSKELMKYV